jgi:hypothetical protein
MVTLIFNGSWAWSLPSIALSVVLHVLGLSFINANVIRILAVVKNHPQFLTIFSMVIGATVLLATILHGSKRRSGARLSAPGRRGRQQICAALFTRGDYDLWP